MICVNLKVIGNIASLPGGGGGEGIYTVDQITMTNSKVASAV